MPDLAHLTAFAIAALTVAVIPGPAMLYVLARTLGGGRQVGLRSSVGTGLGGLVHVALAAVGLSALIAASATAFTVVKFLGAGYLIWLGCRVLLRSDREPPLGIRGGGAGTGDRALRQGAITELLNPKTALFFLTFLPQFCQPEHGPLLVQVVVLGTASVVLNTLADVVIVLFATRVRAGLRRRPRLWRRQQIATGSILVGLGVYTAASGHRAD